MIIEEGYWNYYLTFRIENIKKFYAEIERKKTISGVIAVITGEDVLINKENENLLKVRKIQMQQYMDILQSNVTIEKKRELYRTNHLPEYYFDFDIKLHDLLGEKIEDSISKVMFINHSYRQVLHFEGESKCSYYVLMPLKVYITDWEFIYCTVYIQLLSNGIGIIKLEMPLKDVSAEDISNYPMKRWFSYIKVWDALFSRNGDKRYKIVKGEKEGVQDITQSLINYVQNIFSESIVGGERAIGFETFVISKSSNYDIINTDKNNNGDCLNQIYHLTLPEDFAFTPSNEELKQFWGNSHFNASGIHVVKGDKARMIMYADVSQLLRRNRREDEDIKNYNDYLQSSVSGTFDPFLILALAQKDNEMTIYRIAEKDSHTVSKNMVRYYGNANYLDGMLENAPKHGIIFYNEVRKMLNNFPVDFREMLDRIQRIEEYEKMSLNEKQGNLLNRFTLLFTVFFGLPLIQDTLLVLKTTFETKRDLIPFITVNHISLVFWIIILFYMITDNINGYLEYEGIMIKGRLTFRRRLISLLLVIARWFQRIK